MKEALPQARLLASLAIIFIGTLCPNLTFGQNGQGDWWFFGNRAGLHFGPDGVVAEPDGVLLTLEGCSSISSPGGDLLFYTDGIKVFNRNHQLMEHGDHLKGSNTSTNSGLIVPKPGNLKRFFIFTTDYQAHANGLHYTEVDLTLDGGLGDVVTTAKNVPLASPVSEKIAVIQHRNGHDFWVLTHEWNSNQFSAYLVTSSGVNSTPVASHVGVVHGQSGDNLEATGQMKFSADGSRLAVALDKSTHSIELFEFDRATGIVSNPVVLHPGTITRAYGLEFSPDGALLYANHRKNLGLVQYDLTAGNGIDITNSMQTLDPSLDFGALQMGPDHQVYVARNNAVSLSVIKKPNELAPNCSFNADVIDLADRKCIYGLPAFVQSNFFVPFVFESGCEGETIDFDLWIPGLDSVIWDFEDPTDNDPGISRQMEPSHVFSSPGTFTVRLITWAGSASDTFTRNIEIRPIPNIQLGLDTFLCGRSLLLDPLFDLTGTGFIWNDSSTTSSITVTQSGTYTVTVSNECGIASDDIVVEFGPEAPILERGYDHEVCPGEEVTLEAAIENVEYLWSDGSESPTLVTTEPGTYSVTVSNACGTDSRSEEVIHNLDICPPPLSECLVIPNVFTPNGDGFNDRFVLTSDCAAVDMELTVFNRWGNPVFRTTSVDESWDGRNQQGRDAESGTYFYTLQFGTDDYPGAEPELVSGSIQLLR